MTKLLLQSYQVEYETTDITIDNLCAKYDIEPKDLKGYTKWRKTYEEQEAVIEAETEPISVTPITESAAQPIVTVEEPEQTLVPAKVDEGDETVLAKISDFKRQAVDHAVRFMADDVRFAEVKEFKDMVAIVDSIEKSFKGTSEGGNTINVMIQNIMSEHADDC